MQKGILIKIAEKHSLMYTNYKLNLIFEGSKLLIFNWEN